MPRLVQELKDDPRWTVEEMIDWSPAAPQKGSHASK